MNPAPFLRWAGGKTRLLPELLARVPVGFSRYVEPFVGGGTLFWALPRGIPALLCDTNPELVMTYKAIQGATDDVWEALSVLRDAHAEDPEGTYQLVRSMDPAELDGVERAARFIYLNKAGFNGIYRVNRAGKFNVPIGTPGKKRDLAVPGVDLLRACAGALEYADVHHREFQESIWPAGPGDFIYADPPYAPVSATSNFTAYTSDGFTHLDQHLLMEYLLKAKRAGAKILASNSDCPAIRELYSGPDFVIEQVEVHRSISAKSGSRGSVKELLIS